MAACAYTKHDFWQYVDEYYTVSKYLASYTPQFQPIHTPEYWNNPDMPILQPNMKRVRHKGRPQETRIRNEMDWEEHWKEPGNRQQCGVCKGEGHDRRTCPQARGEASNSRNLEANS